MKALQTTLMALAVALGGCDEASKGDGDKGGDKDGGKDGGKEAKPEPFAGPLTTDLLMGAKQIVSPFDDWDEALGKVEGTLGKPTLVADKEYSWGVVDGDKCSYLTVEDAGGQVGTVEGPNQVDKMLESMFNDCAKKAGQKIEEPKEDPNAPGPPEPGSGTVIKPSQIVAGIAAAKSRWAGAKVKVEGVFLSATTSKATGSDETTVIVSIRDDKESKDSIGCTLPKGSEAPKIMQYTPVVAEGTVTDTFGGALEDCTLAQAAPADGDAKAPAEGDTKAPPEGDPKAPAK